jgi:hypothetical protein
MATNKSTLEALEHMHNLLKELSAWNELFKFHISAQKAQGGEYENDKYKYNKETNSIERYRNGALVRSF